MWGVGAGVLTAKEQEGTLGSDRNSLYLDCSGGNTAIYINSSNGTVRSVNFTLGKLCLNKPDLKKKMYTNKTFI